MNAGGTPAAPVRGAADGRGRPSPQRRAWFLGAIVVLLAACAWAGPRLYVGSEGWGAVAGEDGKTIWIGRIPAGAESVEAGGEVFPVAEGRPLPEGAAALPGKNNPFGDCIVRSLTGRFDAAIKGRNWSLIGSSAGKAGEFARLKDAKGGDLKLVFTLEDAQSGAEWRLVPERMGQEGGVYSWFRGSARAYAGTLDDGKIDWLVATEKMGDGRWIVQGRVLLMEKESRFFRLRAGVADAPGAVPVAGWNGGTEQAAGVAVRRDDGAAVALLADLSEPRRMRAVPDAAEEGMALEFDLAATPATANFPRRAAFSVTLETWKSGSGNAADLERAAAERWVRPVAGGEAIASEEAGMMRLEMWCPGRATWEAKQTPDGFEGKEDAWGCLEVLASGLAPEGRELAKERATARSCAARDADGKPVVSLATAGWASAPVNMDPDLRMPFSAGVNRGQWARERCLAGCTTGTWVCVEVAGEGLDWQARALEMCDYPAVWEEGSWRPAVALAHAEAEWLLAMACAVRGAGGRLCVLDDGPCAPFTVHAADAVMSGAVDGPPCAERACSPATGRACGRRRSRKRAARGKRRLPRQGRWRGSWGSSSTGNDRRHGRGGKSGKFPEERGRTKRRNDEGTKGGRE